MNRTTSNPLIAAAALFLVISACDHEAGGEYIPPVFSKWCDHITRLCWQDPPYEEGLDWDDAVNYCENLHLAFYDDWRLPNIDELRTLIRGTSDTETAGRCKVTDETAATDHDTRYCSSNNRLEGDGSDGCYWHISLSSSCGGDFVSFWSSSVTEHSEYAWQVWFTTGSIGESHKNKRSNIRCVREN